MAKCDICGKGVTFGIQVSHSHRRSNRTWNLIFGVTLNMLKALCTSGCFFSAHYFCSMLR